MVDLGNVNLNAATAEYEREIALLHEQARIEARKAEIAAFEAWQISVSWRMRPVPAHKAAA